MDINEASNSRILAILIENVVSRDRSRFIEDAKKAKNMEAFAKGLGSYKTVYDDLLRD